MGEEVDGISDYGGPAADKNEEHVLEWENGLPTADDLIPLSQSLIPQELASAFSISPEPTKTLLDIHRASQSTVSSLRRQVAYNSSSASVKMLPSFAAEAAGRDRTDLDDLDPVVDDGDEGEGKEGGVSETKSLKKARARGSDETEDVGFGSHVENEENSNSGRVSKKPRLVWTPQLQKRFVDVVAHLGLKNAVPKTIMQLMNVEGLTRENVASHLQKYRLYIKRMRGISDEGASSSSPPPPPPPAADNSHQRRVTTTGTHVLSLTPYASPHGMLPMPMTGMDHHPYAMFGDNFGAVPPRSSCQ